MKYMVDPVAVSHALTAMAKMAKPNSGNPRVRLIFGENAICISRADREQLVEFTIPAKGTPFKAEQSNTVSLDWAKFGGVMKNGVAAKDVELSFDEDATFVQLKQGSAIKVKLPLTNNDTRIPFAQTDALQYALAPEVTAAFFEALTLVSTFCVDKIVGRGKFSGVVVHGDRVVASSHEGVFAANVQLGLPECLGVPAGVLWTLLQLTASTDVALTYGLSPVPTGQVKSAYITGTFHGLPWLVEFAFNQPYHTFLGSDLLKPIPVPPLAFTATVESSFLHTGFATASSIQGKPDVWVELVGLSEAGFSIRGQDIAHTVESSVAVPVISMTGQAPDTTILVKKSGFLELLSRLSGPVDFGFDEKGGKMVLTHPSGVGFMACTLGDD